MANKNNKDDFFASNYDEYENNEKEPYDPEDYANKLEEALNEDLKSISNGISWNLELSEHDKDKHNFMICTLDPLIKKLIVPVDYYDEMFNCFVRTFDKDAGVPVGKRNS